MRCSVGVAVALLAAVASELYAQQSARGRGAIVGEVISREGAAALPNTIVALPHHGRERFTSSTGAFVFGDVPAGRTTVRVRRLGFEPVELTVDVRAGRTDTVRVRLQRVAVHLAAVGVEAMPPCLRPGAPRPSRDSTLAVIYGQLLLNAEQFRLLSREYPFSLVLVSTLSNKTRDGQMLTTEVDTLRLRSDGGWNYEPGRVLALERRGGNRAKVTFLIPTLENFADPEFADSHCFHYGGLANIGDSTYIKIDFVAAQRIRTTDVDGSILLHPETFQIRRTILQLTRIPIPGLREAEVVTDFRELLPSVPVIGRVVSTQTLDPRRRGYVNAFEEKQLTEITFLGQRPGEDKKP